MLPEKVQARAMRQPSRSSVLTHRHWTQQRAGSDSRVQRQPGDCQGRHPGKPVIKPGSAGHHLGTSTAVTYFRAGLGAWHKLKWYFWALRVRGFSFKLVWAMK